MEPLEFIAMANAALSIYEKLSKIIAEKIAAGEISIDAQAQLQARIDAIRSGKAFEGPEWKQSTEVPPPTQE